MNAGIFLFFFLLFGDGVINKDAQSEGSFFQGCWRASWRCFDAYQQEMEMGPQESLLLVLIFAY